jgi:SAM-dependent methyltransferase
MESKPLDAAPSPAPEDKSLFYYGGLYRRIFDPLIRPSRNAVVQRIPAGSSVLDIGCGTGALCFDLRRVKNCRVVGIDLSRKMLDFARSVNRYEDVEFRHVDAAGIGGDGAESFDYAVILNVVHELTPDGRVKLLREAFRLARNTIVVDVEAPLPWNVAGIVKRLIEITFGFDHYPRFRSYLRSGGLPAVFDACGRSSSIVERTVCDRGIHLLVRASR